MNRSVPIATLRRDHKVGGHNVVWVLIGLLLSACSLAEDITPSPAQIAPATPLAPAPPSAVTDPLAVLAGIKPSAESGAPLFAQHCAACHGPLGEGDGEQAAQLPNPPARLSDPALARTRSPRDWFDVITNGRLEKFMPPFAQSLTDEQRWHLVAFLYTLSTPPSQMQTGGGIYAAQCADCHGADGKRGPDFSSADFFATRSADDVSASIVASDAHAGRISLSDDERWAVTAFVRGFAFEYLAPGAAPPERTGAVAGQVTNGTAGAALPESLDLTLFGIEAEGLVLTRTTTIRAEGAFQFDDVPYKAGQQFVVSAGYNGVEYYSELLPFSPGQAQLTLPLTIYETTSDPASLRINHAQTFILFDQPGTGGSSASFSPQRGAATIGQLFTLGNSGDRTFVPAERSAVQFSLPSDTTEFAMPDGEEGVTYLRVGDNVADLRPVPPGEATLDVLLSYRLPESQGLSFSQPLRYPTDVANVLIGDPAAQLSGAGWERAGTQSVQGAHFITYTREDIPAGDSLAFTVARGAAASAPGVAAGAAALVVTGAVLCGWWARNRRLAPAVSARDALLNQLAALDDDFAEGKLNQEWYEKRRAELKGQLKEIWERTA